jgi:hypothetical protein
MSGEDIQVWETIYIYIYIYILINLQYLLFIPF